MFFNSKLKLLWFYLSIILSQFLCAMAPPQTILIVGGGPMGLRTSIALKLHDPNINVVIYEKRDIKTRDNLLNIDLKAFLNLGITEDRSEIWKQYVEEIINEKSTGTKDDSMSFIIETRELENRLQKLAEYLNVNFVNKEINADNIQETLELQSQTGGINLVIGADGANSFIRKHFFKDEKPVYHTFQYLGFIRVIYEGKFTTTNGLDYVLDQNKLSQEGLYNLKEIPGDFDSESDSTPSVIFVDLPESDFNVLKNNRVTFKNPILYLEKEENQRLPENFRHTVDYWFQKLAPKEHSFVESPKISAVEIGYYRANKVAHFDHEFQIPFVIIGDAALGLPYQKSLNAALTSTPILFNTISGILSGDPQAAINSYNAQFEELAGKSIKSALKKEKIVKNQKKSLVFFATLCNIPGIRESRIWGADVLNKVFKGKSKNTFGRLIHFLDPSAYYSLYSDESA